jgi:hypothetical protein
MILHAETSEMPEGIAWRPCVPLVHVMRAVLAEVVCLDVPRAVVPDAHASIPTATLKRRRNLRIDVERTEVLVDRIHGLEAHERGARRMERGRVKCGLLCLCVHGSSG